jgi:integrase
MDFGSLAHATQRDRRLILERFRSTYGERSFAILQRRHVEPMVAAKAATPHAVRSFLKALRAVVALARRAGIRDDDPTEGIRVKLRATAGFRTWAEDDIARFETVYPIGSRARLAFALLLFTGQRRGDAIRLGRQHVKGGFLTVRQGKTGATVVIPLHPELQAILAASKTGNLTFLTTATGKPFAPGAFTNWFGTLCRAAGLPLGLSAHGLRKAMCRRLAEAGCSANQIAAAM